MTSKWWRALEHLGARSAAACDWRHYLGEEFDSCLPLLRQVTGQAETVIDPERPSRRLDVVPDGVDGFVGILGDDTPDGPPHPLTAADVALVIPDWQAVGDALGRALGFSANRYENEGLTRQIGIAQNGIDAARPVVLCLSAGHLGDHGRIADDLAARRDATVLLPSTRSITPPIQALASANRLTLVGIADTLAATAAANVVPDIAAPAPVSGAKKRKKPILTVQPGWRWDMLTIEVTTGGQFIASCGGQRKSHRLPKSNSKTHSKDYETLMGLAVNGKWRNPPVRTPENEALRKQFYRFRETLCQLIPIPGNAFATDGEDWIPEFKVQMHKDLGEMKAGFSEADEPDDLPAWHPLTQPDTTLE